MQMIDVGDKARTDRVAIATGRVVAAASTLRAIARGEIVKGDVLAAARLAAVMGAKRTPELVPLCHPIALTGVDVDVRVRRDHVAIRVQVKTTDRTGVEMEALTAVSAAALTVYDMLKSIDRGMVIESVQLEHKSGGRSGVWTRKDVGEAKLKSRRK